MERMKLGADDAHRAPRTVGDTLALGIEAVSAIREAAREQSFRTPPATRYIASTEGWCRVEWPEGATRPVCTVCFAGALIAHRFAPMHSGHYTPDALATPWAETIERLDALRTGSLDDALMGCHVGITGENADAFAAAVRARTGDACAPPGAAMRSWREADTLLDAFKHRWLPGIRAEEPVALARAHKDAQ